MRPRLIPCLLLRGAGLVKTVKFAEPKYLGDPINIVRIFNDKEVDELIVLDIDATRRSRAPDFALIHDLATECFMPLCYGGGVRTVDEMQRLFASGVEKVALNTAAQREPGLVRRAAERFGSQSVVASLDVKRGWFGAYEVCTDGATKGTGLKPGDAAARLEDEGAGEILLTAVDRDGTMQGYDLKLVEEVARRVKVPVVACGGAGSLSDVRAVVRDAGASAAAAGSMFVFQGPHRGVLINYPPYEEIVRLLGN